MNKNELQDLREIPNYWIKTTLGQVLPIYYGKGLPKAKREESGIHPVYGSSGLLGYHSKALTKGPTLIIGRKGSVGEVHYSSAACWPIDTVYYVEENDNLDLRFFKYLFRGLNLSKLDKSTAVPSLSRDDYNVIEIALAPFNERKLIVAEIEKQFSRLDEAVTSLKRVKTNLKRYKAAVLKAAVEGKLTEEWRKHNPDVEPASELLKRILAERKKKWEEDYVKKYVGAHGHAPKDDSWKKKYKETALPDTSNLPKLTKGWVWATVEQINNAPRPCAYGVLQPGPDVAEGVPLVRVGDINDGRIEIANLKKISNKIADKYPRTSLQGGEVLITLVGAIGRTAVVPNSLARANTARAVGVIPLTDLVNSRWVEIWFRNPSKLADMTSRAHEVARKTLNLEDVRVATIALPPEAEQCFIVNEVEQRLSVVEEAEEAIEVNLKRAERLRQSILKKAFSGQLHIINE